MQVSLSKCMKKADIKYIRNLYNKRYKSKIQNYKIQGWGTKKSQLKRFEILSKIGLLKNKSILDIGCGLGDLNIFLRKKKIKKYTGIDISDLFIKHCEKKFRKDNSKFINDDFLNYRFKENYDFIFMSGALNLKFKNKDNLNIAKKFIRKAYELSNIGCSFNFLSTKVDYQSIKDFHFDPLEILRICSNITSNFTLKHDYKMYEFTIYIYK